MGDNESLGDEVTGPALVLLLALLVFLDDAVGLGLPALVGDQVAIILHGLGPILHQALIDVVAVNERLAGVVGEEALGELHDDLLGMAADVQRFEPWDALLPPGGEVSVHADDEGGELGMLVDGGLDRRFLHREAEIARAELLEQGVPELRADVPVAVERIDVGLRDAAPQVALDVLQILGRLAVDVARQVEVVLVLFDLLMGDHARVFRDVELLVEDVHDAVNVHLAQAVLGAVLHEAAAGVDHEDAFAGLGALLVDHHDAGRDAGAIEEVGGQAYDAFDVAFADQGAADVGLGVAAEQHAVRQDAGSLGGGLEGADDVQQIGVVALLGGRDAEGLESIERIVQRIEAGAPALVGKGWVGDDVVEGLEGLAVFFLEEGVRESVPLPNIRCGIAVQDHVHASEAAGGGILLLSVDGDAGGGFVRHLQEEGARAAGGVVDGG